MIMKSYVHVYVRVCMCVRKWRQKRKGTRKQVLDWQYAYGRRVGEGNTCIHWNLGNLAEGYTHSIVHFCDFSVSLIWHGNNKEYYRDYP